MKLGLLVQPVIPALGSLRQENLGSRKALGKKVSEIL
jgi:hypothetical protein